MARYIDVDKVVYGIKRKASKVELNETAKFTIDAVVKLLKEVTPADVEEVKHGEWEKKTDDICYWYECSECSDPIPYNKYKSMYFSNRCPNCGAKMDGRSNT